MKVFEEPILLRKQSITTFSLISAFVRALRVLQCRKRGCITVFIPLSFYIIVSASSRVFKSRVALNNSSRPPRVLCFQLMTNSSEQ